MREKKRRESVPIPSVSNSKSIASSCEPDRGVRSTLYVILPQVNTISVQTGPELFDAACQTSVKSIRFVVSPFPVDNCAEVVNSGSSSTRFTQTVSVIRNTSWEKIVSNPHPDIVQEVLSKGKKKKTQLTQLQKAIRWKYSDKKEALKKYNTCL